MNDLQQTNGVFDLTPRSLSEAMELAKIIADSDVVPRCYQGKPGNVLVAVQMGAEIGLKPMQALQNIAVVNGNPSVWGDAIPALIQSHPKYEWMKEEYDEANQVAICTIKRRGEDPHTVYFGVEDARRAGLLNKDTYKNYLKRMLQMRARAWAARDKFADALKGLKIGEEVQDYPTEARDITPPPSAPAARAEAVLEHLPPYPADKFERLLPTWRGAIEAGKKTADEIIAFVGSKAALTDEQKAMIRGEHNATDAEQEEVA